MRIAVAFLLCAATVLLADPTPGDVYREYVYGRRFSEFDLNSKRMEERVRRMRANSRADRVIEIPGAGNAVKAEVSIEYWGGHIGTTEQKFQINDDGEWFDIPQPQETPEKPNCYYRTMLGRATVTVPVSKFKPGRNVLRFHAGPQVCHGFDWGFYWVYSFTVRLYSKTGKGLGRIVSPAEGEEISDRPRIVVEAAREDMSISSVDVIGKYEDFNWEGDGVFRQWHYITQRGQVRKHIGTATEAPYAVTWDTSWVPDQTEPVELAARITDSDGNIYMTQPVKVRLNRQARSVKMYKALDVPTAFGVRVKRTKECRFDVPDDLSRARTARIVLSTWSAAHDGEISLNKTKLVDRIGLVHNYSFDSIPVPLRVIKPGANVFSIYSATEEHAAEVNWPGPVLLIEYGPAAPRSVEAPSAAIAVEDNVDCAGQPSFRIKTPSATYCYQKEGAGFASIVDNDGNEWIGYKPGGRAAGEFRGIPNLGNDFGHPGYSGDRGSRSRIVENGPGKVSMVSERVDGKWASRWDIFPTHARLTILRAEKPYWFLYEGTPGGRLDLEKGFSFTSDGMRRSLAAPWSGDMLGPEWIYFANTDSRYALFVANHSDDDAPDQYWPMDGSMTVFGFGREYRCCRQFLTGERQFTIGLVPNGSFDSVRRRIETYVK